MSVPRSIAFLLLGFASAVSAQDPAQAPSAVPVPAVPNSVPTLPPGVPVPGNVPAPAAGAPAQMPAPAIVRPALSLGETKITEPIEEPKLSGSALAGLYRKYTGRRVIISSAATTAEFSFIQDASPKDPLTYALAAELLKKAATIENFVFVPDEQDPNLDILTLSTGGIRPTGRGVAVYNENDAIPEGDAVISYVMNLSYIKPAEAVNTFTQIIGQFGAYGSIAPVPNASAVVITENTSLIRKLIDLKKEIDKPSSQVGTRFIKVQFADVTEIASTLTELLTAQQSAQTTAGIQRADNAAAPIPGAPPVAGSGQNGASSSGEATPVQIIPDPRTNRIFAMGRPVDLLFVEGLVREFDVETSEKNFLRRKLRFLTVSEFLPIAGDALTRAFSGTGDSGGGGGSASGGATPPGASRNAGAQNGAGNRQNGSSSRSGSSSRGSGRSGSSGSSGFGGGGGSSGFGGGGGSGGSGGGSGLDSPSVSSAPESKLVGRTLLVADNITNSIVVQGPPSGLEIIERLLDQIDVKPDQVMISTVIGTLSLGNSSDTGVDYLYQGSNGSGRAGGGFGAILPILKFLPEIAAIPAIPEDLSTPGDQSKPAIPAVPAKNTFFDPGSLGQGGGLRAYGTIGNLGVYLKALQSKSNFTVLSRPSIFTSNNQKGTISSGQRIAIPTGTNNSGNFSSTQVEYQDVVLKLEVIPLVNSDNEITMQISLLNDQQDGTTPIAGVGDVPKISTREILTTATVPNNETIVLGGLIISNNSDSKSGIPILSDIPFLGRLFSSNTKSKDRSELMVFIQPSIVNSERSLNNVQADMDNRYKVSSKAREFADGPGVLPPVNAITPVADKSGNAPKTRPVSESQAPSVKKKLSFGAPHRN